MVSPLLVTKLQLPSTRSPLVQRKHLLEKLNQGFSRKLILISAAGFGKTTVLSEWVQQAKLPVGWLSLEDFETAWIALQRAHVLGQRDTIAHWNMLKLAWKQRDFRESMGQLMPVLLAVSLWVRRANTLEGGVCGGIATLYRFRK